MADMVKYGAIAGLVVYLVSVIVLCTMPTGSMPQVDLTLMGIPTDKVAHFLIFLPYPILTWFASDKSGRCFKRKIAMAGLIFAGGLAMAAGTEVLQTFTEYRDGEVLDFAADCAGLATGMVIVMSTAYIVEKRRK